MSPRVNLPSDITVGQLRRLVHGGLDERLTLAEALTALQEGDRVGAEHEAVTREYGQYVARRQARHAEALAAAAATVRDDPGMASTDGYQRRQEARRDAAETFELRAPLLSFQEWVDRDQPAVYEVGAIKRVLKSVKRPETVF